MLLGTFFQHRVYWLRLRVGARRVAFAQYIRYTVWVGAVVRYVSGTCGALGQNIVSATNTFEDQNACLFSQSLSHIYVAQTFTNVSSCDDVTGMDVLSQRRAVAEFDARLASD